jgi:competence protein ComGC
MPRRAYTLVELFLVIFVGSILLAIALPFFRPESVSVAQSVSENFGRLEKAKTVYAEKHALAPGASVTLADLRRDGVLTLTPLAPEGCEFALGTVGEPVTLHLRK